MSAVRGPSRPERTLPVVLAKVAASPHVALRWPRGGPVTAEGFLAPLLDRGLVSVESVEDTGESHPRLYPTLTERGRTAASRATPTALVGELGSRPHPAGSPNDRALTALLYVTLVHGGSASRYGGVESFYGTVGEVAHALSCGVDLARSGPVVDDSWDEWVADLSDPRRTVGLSGRVTCSCGVVRDHEVSVDLESPSAVLRAVSATPW